MKDNRSYKSRKTAQVESVTAYEKDFKSPGQFVEEDAEDEICLMVEMWPGMYDGKRWIDQGATDNEAFAVCIYYKNQKQIDVSFSAECGKGAHLKQSFDFVREAAQKFFLLNQFILKEQKEELKWIHEEPTWEDVESVISEHTRTSVDLRDGNSWSKTMTLVEAKELFEYLGIGIDFPS